MYAAIACRFLAVMGSSWRSKSTCSQCNIPFSVSLDPHQQHGDSPLACPCVLLGPGLERTRGVVESASKRRRHIYGSIRIKQMNMFVWTQRRDVLPKARWMNHARWAECCTFPCDVRPDVWGYLRSSSVSVSSPRCFYIATLQRLQIVPVCGCTDCKTRRVTDSV